METPGMEFTGERLVPGVDGLEELYTEHMSRYLVAAAISEGRRVLDVGCGCGYGTHLLSAAGAVGSLGVDISPEAIDFAAGRYSRSGLAFRVMDARRLDLDNRFDLVTCFELIEHVEEDEAVVESMAGVLAEDGICLVSTPNAETYAAGGEEGDNPYHFREYGVGQFEALLKSGFGGVSMLEQRWTDGILIGAASALEASGGGEGRLALIPDEQGEVPGSASYGPAPYFLAVCTKSPEPRLPEVLLRPFGAMAPNKRYGKLKQEFDNRGRWARSLDEELRTRDAAITRLRGEKDRLQQEFDERGLWAQGLDREIAEKNRIIENLMAEIEQLKRATMMTRR